MRAAFPDARKAELAFGELWQRAAASPPITREEILALAPEERTAFRLGNARHPHLTLTPEEVARSQEVNQSVYLVRAPALFYALERLRPDNAQREEYLSDIVSILAQVHDHGRQHYRVAALTVTDPSLVMGFNNPAELLEIENTLRAKEAASRPAEAASAESYRTGGERSECRRLATLLCAEMTTVFEAEKRTQPPTPDR